MKFTTSEKIVFGAIAVYVLVCIADMVLPPAPSRPITDPYLQGTLWNYNSATFSK